MGLSISNDIAQYLGPKGKGGITIDSTEGKGSVFSFLIESKTEVQAMSFLGIPSKPAITHKQVESKNDLSYTIVEEDSNSINSPESPFKHIESGELEELDKFQVLDQRKSIEDREILFSSFGVMNSPLKEL